MAGRAQIFDLSAVKSLQSVADQPVGCKLALTNLLDKSPDSAYETAKHALQYALDEAAVPIDRRELYRVERVFPPRGRPADQCTLDGDSAQPELLVKIAQAIAERPGTAACGVGVGHHWSARETGVDQTREIRIEFSVGDSSNPSVVQQAIQMISWSEVAKSVRSHLTSHGVATSERQFWSTTPARTEDKATGYPSYYFNLPHHDSSTIDALTTFNPTPGSLPHFHHNFPARPATADAAAHGPLSLSATFRRSQFTPRLGPWTIRLHGFLPVIEEEHAPAVLVSALLGPAQAAGIPGSIELYSFSRGTGTARYLLGTLNFSVSTWELAKFAVSTVRFVPETFTLDDGNSVTFAPGPMSLELAIRFNPFEKNSNATAPSSSVVKRFQDQLDANRDELIKSRTANDELRAELRAANEANALTAQQMRLMFSYIIAQNANFAAQLNRSENRQALESTNARLEQCSLTLLLARRLQAAEPDDLTAQILAQQKDTFQSLTNAKAELEAAKPAIEAAAAAAGTQFNALTPKIIAIASTAHAQPLGDPTGVNTLEELTADHYPETLIGSLPQGGERGQLHLLEDGEASETRVSYSPPPHGPPPPAQQNNDEHAYMAVDQPTPVQAAAAGPPLPLGDETTPALSPTVSSPSTPRKSRTTAPDSTPNTPKVKNSSTSTPKNSTLSPKPLISRTLRSSPRTLTRSASAGLVQDQRSMTETDMDIGYPSSPAPHSQPML